MKTIFDFLSVGEKNAITMRSRQAQIAKAAAAAEALLNEMRQEGTQA